MEPLKPETKQLILDTNPAATPQDIDEYERLLSERFAHDPDHPSPQAQAVRAARETRLAELHRKLFPGVYGQRPGRP